MRSAARDEPKVVCPAVRAALARGEEFDEVAAGAVAAGANNGQQRLKPGTAQHRRRLDLVGQYDRQLRHNRPKADCGDPLFQERCSDFVAALAGVVE
jgi:hypothetical protein